ncbi:MAG: hypothetical protein K2X47_13440 [Bdellovibrionales bacterium]|nr:hypothetical protein [Bdellovibrionales bacterium]
MKLLTNAIFSLAITLSTHVVCAGTINVDFQDGDGDPSSYGGGYYTSTTTKQGTFTYPTGYKDTTVSITYDKPTITEGHVYRNDGFVEHYTLGGQINSYNGIVCYDASRGINNCDTIANQKSHNCETNWNGDEVCD